MKNKKIVPMSLADILKYTRDMIKDIDEILKAEDSVLIKQVVLKDRNYFVNVLEHLDRLKGLES